MSKKILSCLLVMKPFTQDINAELYGRKIARQTKANQKTVQNKLNLLKEKKVLKDRKEGKIKYFKLNKKNPATRTTLIATEIKKLHELIEKSFEVKEIIQEINQQTKNPVIIYGSFAKSKWNKESDLDILIIGKKQSFEKIKNKYNRKIQVMHLKPKEFSKHLKEKTHYIKEVLKNHIICQGFEYVTRERLEND